MADPLAIIGVIGVAGQLTKALVSLGLDWKDAPADVKDFILELQTLKSTLSESHTNILLNPDFTNAFEGRHSAVLSHLGNDAPSTDARLLVDACHVELKRLLANLEKRSRGHRAGWERVKGAFMAGRTREAVEKLQRQCQTLNSLVAIDSAALGAAVLNEVREGRREQMDQKAAAHRNAVLDWLTPKDYAAQQSDHLGRRRLGTGEWLIDSEEYSTWCGEGGRILFCPGIPGAGKTIITSIVVDDLARKANQATCVAYVYCDFRQHGEQTAQNLLSSLLRQLTRGQTSLPDSVDTLHQKHSQPGTRPSMAELCATLTSVASLYSRVFVVVDALDESPFDERDTLLEALSDLHNNAQASLFATARPEVLSHFSEHFKGYSSKEIRAADRDILNYVNGRLSAVRRPRLSKFPELQDAIRKKIVEAADGMFLLSVLQLNHLLSQATAGDIEDELTHLPRGLSGLDVLYGQAMQRIGSQSAGRNGLTMRVLTWIVHARRPLSATELQVAVAIRPGDKELNEKHLTEIEDLVSDCAGLVTVDDESNVVRLVHFTTQDYFERTRATWFPDAEARILEICITYLSFDAFGIDSWPIKHDNDVDDEQDECHDTLPFYIYAAAFWADHARESGADPNQSAVDFLEDVPKVRESFRRIWKRMHTYYGLEYPTAGKGPFWPVLHLLAYRGVARYVTFLINRFGDPDPLNYLDRTPLSIAAAQGHISTAETLLSHGADPHHETSTGSTPLMEAAGGGHKGVIELLLSYGADVNHRSIFDHSPLLFAAWQGPRNVAVLLIAHGADTHHRDDLGLTPLAWAARGGNVAVVQTLLDVDTLDLNGVCRLGRTPLWYSMEAGDTVTTAILLARGADPSRSDVLGLSPLHGASMKGNRENFKAVEMLLADGRVDVNARDELGRTPLHLAVENDKDTLARALLGLEDIDPNAVDRKGHTPLHWAVEKDNDTLVKALLGCEDIDPNVADHEGCTPLLLCAILLSESYGVKKRATAELLVVSDKIHVNKRDSYGLTALAFAARAGCDWLVSLLLSQGADPDIADDSGKTALELAAGKERGGVVRLLLSHGGENADRFGWL